MAKVFSSKALSSLQRLIVSPKVIEAEALWTTFVAQHNLAFETSNHATKLFYRMFPDSEIAIKKMPMDTVRLQLLSRKPWLLTISLKPFMTCPRYIL